MHAYSNAYPLESFETTSKLTKVNFEKAQRKLSSEIQTNCGVENDSS